MDQDATLYRGRPRGPHCVRWGSSSPKRGIADPSFRHMPIVANHWMDQDASWYGSGSQPMQHCVRWGPSSPLPLKGAHQPPTFWPMSIVAKMVGRIKLPLDKEIGLGPGNTVLHGAQLPFPRKEHSSPTLFGPCLLCSNGCPSQQLLSSCYYYYIIRLHRPHHMQPIVTDGVAW